MSFSTDQAPRPPKWLRGGNRETLYAKYLQRPAPAYRRELLPDRFGEDLTAYDFLDAPDKNAPCIVLLHGLEGSSRSHYAVELALTAQAHGWHSVTAHRSGMRKSTQSAYHSAATSWQNISVKRAQPPSPAPPPPCPSRLTWQRLPAPCNTASPTCSTHPISCTR